MLVAFLAAIIGVAMVVVDPGSPPALPAAAVLLTFAVVLVLGIRLERAFVRSILDGA